MIFFIMYRSLLPFLSTPATASIVLRTAATAFIVLSTARKLLFAAAAGLCQPYFLVGCYCKLQHLLVVQIRGSEQQRGGEADWEEIEATWDCLRILTNLEI